MKNRGSAVLLPRLAVVTPRLCRRFSGQNRGVSARTGTYRSASAATPGMHRQTIAFSGHTVIFAPNRVWSVALPGIYERTRIPSRFVPVRPGPPAANCRDAPGHTPGQCERGLSTIENKCMFRDNRLK